MTNYAYEGNNIMEMNSEHKVMVIWTEGITLLTHY